MLALVIERLAVSFAGMSTPVLAVDQLSIGAGERVAITGGSGSGKSTFINVATGLEKATSGRILWNGEDITRFSESRRDRWRAEHVGLVMQDFHLFPGLSAVENVLLPARLARVTNAALITRPGTRRTRRPSARPGPRPRMRHPTRPRG